MIEKIINDNFYKSKALTKSLKFVSENSALYNAGVCLALSATLRPASTLIAPKISEEDRKISFTKSISSALTGFLFTTAVSLPFSKAIKNIDKNPRAYLTPDTIKNLSNGLDNVADSKSYQFATQLFKLGLGCVLAYPKALANNAIIKKKINEKPKNKEKQSFKGKLENIISSTINNKNVQKLSNKMQHTNYTTHLMALGDVFSTMAFTTITSKNKDLNNHQKKILNFNSLISTALCLITGYKLDEASNEQMGKFIENLSKANKNSPDLAKYVEGAKIVKTSLIFGGIYYCLIPLVSTLLSSKLSNEDLKEKVKNLNPFKKKIV